MKKIVFLFVLSLSIVTQIKVQAQSQNSIVSLPPNFVQYSQLPPFSPSQPLPLPSPGGQSGPFTPNYAGQISQFTHAAMQDKDGGVLFFIVDGI